MIIVIYLHVIKKVNDLPVTTLTVTFAVVTRASAAPFLSLAATSRVYELSVPKCRLLAEIQPEESSIVNLLSVLPPIYIKEANFICHHNLKIVIF